MKRKIKYGILILFPMLLILFSSVQPAGAQQLDAFSSSVVFNVPLYLPDGYRIDYLRIYFYDTSPTDSQAWVTWYDGEGNYLDVAYVTTTGSAGYGENLSALSGHVVDNYSYSYVLNWRPWVFSSSFTTSAMQLFGMRVALCDAADPAPCGNFEYVHIPGVVFTPRNSTITWSGGIGLGSIHGVYFPVNLPLVKK